MPNTLLIRADANRQIGTGHLMRCLALAQAWQDSGGAVLFITACPVEGLLKRLSDQGFGIQVLDRGYPDPAEWKITEKILRSNPESWVVLDGYHFDPPYQKQIKETGHRLLVIDDMAHLPHYHADIILNQNLPARQLQYSCGPHTRFLLGPRFVLLRREFLKWRGWRREIPSRVKKMLVTLGGSDPNNVTLTVIQALGRLEAAALEVVIVIGESNRHQDELVRAVQNYRFPIRLENNVRDMSQLMARADIAVAGGGITSWELVFMQVPFIALVLADNQRAITNALDQEGVAIAVRDNTAVLSDRLQPIVGRLSGDGRLWADMVKRSRELVDGEGGARVLMQLTGEKFRLRKTSESDCRLIWEWANDPVVRSASFSPEPISWAGHVEWFASKVNDPQCIFYIAIDGDDLPIGQVRFDIENNEATISISLDRGARGKGYGCSLIGRAAKAFFDRTDISIIHAYIKGGNEGSLRAFMKNNFRKVAPTVVRGYPAVHLVLERNGVQQ